MRWRFFNNLIPSILGVVIGAVCVATPVSAFQVYESFSLFDESPQSSTVLDQFFQATDFSNQVLWTQDVDQVAFQATTPEFSTFLFGEFFWSNYIIDTQVVFEKGDEVSFPVHYLDPTNYYRVHVDKKLEEASVYRVENGVETLLEKGTALFQEGPNRIYIDFYQDEIALFINGASVILVQDSTHLSGRIGFSSENSEAIQFQNTTIYYQTSKSSVLSHLNDVVTSTTNSVDFSVLMDRVRVGDLQVNAIQIPDGAQFVNYNFSWQSPTPGNHEAIFEASDSEQTERRTITLTVFDDAAPSSSGGGSAGGGSQAVRPQGSSEVIVLGGSTSSPTSSSSDSSSSDGGEISSSTSSTSSNNSSSSGNSNVNYSGMSNPTVIFGGTATRLSSNNQSSGGSNNNQQNNNSNNENNNPAPTNNDPAPQNDPPPPPPPPAPNIPVLNDISKVTFDATVPLSWSDESASGATTYKMEFATQSDFTGATVNWFLTNSGNVTVPSKGTYYFRVSAFTDNESNGGVGSVPSNVVNGNVFIGARGLDVIQTYPDTFVFNELLPSMSLLTTEQDPTSLDNSVLKFHYDVSSQSFTGIAFQDVLSPTRTVSPFKTINYRMRTDTGADGPVRIILEFKNNGQVLGNVFISDITDTYQDKSFPVYIEGPDIDEVTIVFLGDSDPDGLGDLYIDELFFETADFIPNPLPQVPARIPKTLTDDELLDKLEADMAYYFFQEIIGPGYVKDTNQDNVSSIAATGFGLAAMAILADRYDVNVPHWSRVTPQEAEGRAQILLGNLLNIQNNQALQPDLYGVKGFFYHFIDEDGERYQGTEVSSVDTALLVAGALVAGEYFGGTVKSHADDLYQNIDWTMFLDRTDQQFHHAWKPEFARGFTIFKEGGFLSTTKWNLPTDEILLINLLALGNHPLDDDVQKSFFAYPRQTSSYTFQSGSRQGETVQIYNSFLGSMFTYFYAHCFFDFENLGFDKPDNVMDAPFPTAVDWWQNSVDAIQANRDFAISRSQHFPYSLDNGNSWGFSAVQRPDGRYEGLYGAPPSFNGAGHDGTVAATMPFAALPFFEEIPGEPLADNEAFQTINYLYEHFPNNLFGQYGVFDSYDNEGNFSTTFLGIDTGSALLMMENFRSGLIWNTLAQNSDISSALDIMFSDQVTFLDVECIDNQTNQPVDVDLSFGNVPSGTVFANGEQYLRVDFILSRPGTGVAVYTDNLNNVTNPYTGTGNPAGMVGEIDTSYVAPIRWVVFDSFQPGGYPFTGTSNEGIMQDKGTLGFDTLALLNERTVVDSDGNLAPYPTPSRQTNQGTTYVYFAADYRGLPPQTYSTETITIEIYQLN